MLDLLGLERSGLADFSSIWKVANGRDVIGRRAATRGLDKSVG